MNIPDYILHSTWDVKYDDMEFCINASKGNVSLNLMYGVLEITHDDGFVESHYEFLEDEVSALSLLRDKLDLTTYGGNRLIIPTYCRNVNNVELSSDNASD